VTILRVSGRKLHLEDFATVSELAEIARRSELLRIAVDIPIGLLEVGVPGGRRCDTAARLMVGMRVSSVFTPPTRPALGARTYNEAKAICSMSRQSYGLARRIAEVDRLVTPETQDRIFETHPEVALAALQGRPWLPSKKTTAGRDERLMLLATIVDDVEGLARRRGRHLRMDDILDATVAAVVAARRHQGEARRLPPCPPRDPRGLRMEIWY
jgi:predicted RNase H-like nuclease